MVIPSLAKSSQASERSVSPEKDSDQDFSAEDGIDPSETQPDPVPSEEARRVVKPKLRPLPGLLDEEPSGTQPDSVPSENARGVVKPN